MRHAPRRWLTAIVLLALAGCIEGPQDADTTRPSTTEQTAPATSTTPMSPTTTTSSPATTSTTATTVTTTTEPPRVDFHVGSNYFSPSSASFPAGTTTHWIREQGTHTVTIRRADNGQEVFSREPLGDAGADYRFDAAGTFEVICKYHSSMKATLSVT